MNSCDTNPWDNVGEKGFTFYLICAPFTIIFNFAVLLIAFIYINLKKRFDQWYVINMTLPNLAFGLVYLFLIPFSYSLPRPYCRLYYVILWSCTAAASLFLLILNIHKFITLFMPFKSAQLITKRNVIVQIVSVWVVVVTYSTISSTKLIFYDTDPCYECNVKPEPFMYALMMILFFVCPLILSMIISICIFTLAQRKRKSPTGCNVTGERKMCTRILFLFSYTLFNAATYLPYRIYYTIYVFCSVLSRTADPEEDETYEESEMNCLNPIVMSWLMIVLPFGCMINPLITIVTQRCYRRGLKKCCRRFGIWAVPSDSDEH